MDSLYCAVPVEGRVEGSHYHKPRIIKWATRSGSISEKAIFVECCGQSAILRGGEWKSTRRCDGLLCKRGVLHHPGKLRHTRLSKNQARKGVTVLATWTCCGADAVRAEGAPVHARCLTESIGCKEREVVMSKSLQYEEGLRSKAASFFELSKHTSAMEEAIVLRGDGGSGKAELLAFRGDALLRYLITEYAAKKEGLDIGKGSQYVGYFCSNVVLSSIAQQLDLDLRSASEHEMGTIIEALLCVTFDKKGMKGAEGVVDRMIELAPVPSSQGSAPTPLEVTYKSYVSMCNEWAQARHMQCVFDCQRVGGEDHTPVFEAVIKIEDAFGRSYCEASGERFQEKKKAKEDAARQLYESKLSTE